MASLEAQRKALAEQSELIQVQLTCAARVFLLFCLWQQVGGEAETDEIVQARIQLRLPLK